MSRSAPRNLSLTEELEQLDQAITRQQSRHEYMSQYLRNTPVTLQEIDSNFSKAHRIVTGSFLPIVEQYAKHSSDVWEGSKFWKQFFEASANVSLSGYEEAALEEDATQTDTTATLDTPEGHDEHTAFGADLEDDDEEFSVDSPTQVTGLHTTPRLAPSASKKMNGTGNSAHSKAATFRSPSPRKYTGKNPLAVGNSPEEPSTPRLQTESDQNSSPFQPDSAYRPSAQHQTNDPLLHRVLDKNYRVQATPHTQRRQPRQTAAKPTPATATATRTMPWSDSPDSSPAVAAPQLRSDLFSPAKASRTAGISVMTPARGKPGRPAPTTSTGRRLFSPQDKAYAASRSRASAIFANDESDEDDDSDLMSPPKTMQFHVPQSRLMQTPAREASRKIVEDLLLTAGADATDEIEAEGDELEEASPSVVRRAYDVDDDTF
ncbi:DASH complex subunit ask1 [Friedmanniomyces endolithicus]|uniref:DASH complex subunit ASK1 n=1 Tax=Friedmanniomyces endolithicus TaxID=329885 RepID=A0AAN6FPM5_9PEZI|nr:DASH complex subunit ask1 [Friedmanniomyces endolithicus]KAK0292398.1 DASH complex subunit ask1 [Friedmanniomyces endolithicus]KAK0321738.1 DASH complex subunit ask1 [Friedmanniomyces endolithicus]KAK0920833.1 DASH complex subunit ask1 [Friedmanniomyces endolithicus]KAK0998344.1 DASH complex subunit ask1 [Friedmanniomyces endolithicus]